MADKKIKNYAKVKDLVSKGITSPSVIMSQIPAIKNWRTAQKYINEAIGELEVSANHMNKGKEYSIMLESLKMMKNDLVIKMEDKKNINYYLSLLKYVLKIDDKLIKLMHFDDLPDPRDGKIMLEIVTYDPDKDKKSLSENDSGVKV